MGPIPNESAESKRIGVNLGAEQGATLIVRGAVDASSLAPCLPVSSRYLRFRHRAFAAALAIAALREVGWRGSIEDTVVAALLAVPTK